MQSFSLCSSGCTPSPQLYQVQCLALLLGQWMQENGISLIAVCIVQYSAQLDGWWPNAILLYQLSTTYHSQYYSLLQWLMHCTVLSQIYTSYSPQCSAQPSTIQIMQRMDVLLLANSMQCSCTPLAYAVVVVGLMLPPYQLPTTYYLLLSTQLLWLVVLVVSVLVLCRWMVALCSPPLLALALYYLLLYCQYLLQWLVYQQLDALLDVLLLLSTTRYRPSTTLLSQWMQENGISVVAV